MYSAIPSGAQGTKTYGNTRGETDLGLAIEEMSLDGLTPNGARQNGNGYDDEYDPAADEYARETFGQNIEHACRYVYTGNRAD